jgi:hypothetical protein
MMMMIKNGVLQTLMMPSMIIVDAMGMIRFIHLLSIWGMLLAIYPMMTVGFGSLAVICSDIVVLFLPF